MDDSQPPDNVYALFPGIDTRPFGRSDDRPARQGQLADAGWNTEIPERTLSDDRGARDASHPEQPGRQMPHRLRVRGFRAVLPASSWITIALLAGVALAAGRALLVEPDRPSSHEVASAGTHRSQRLPSTTTPSHVTAHQRTRRRPTPRPEQASKNKHPARAAAGRHETVATKTAAYTQQAIPPPSPGTDSTPVAEPVQTTASTSPASASAASSHPISQPAGPGGLGQLVGTNCDPKCQ
jgi:hypothetical protein